MCLPTSRIKSRNVIPSSSRKFADQPGGIGRITFKVENLANCAWYIPDCMAESSPHWADYAQPICLTDRLIMPVAPPTSAIGLWPARWKCRGSIITLTRWPIWSESAVGNAHISRSHFFWSCSSVPGIMLCIMPRHASSSIKSHQNKILINGAQR